MIVLSVSVPVTTCVNQKRIHAITNDVILQQRQWFWCKKWPLKTWSLLIFKTCSLRYLACYRVPHKKLKFMSEKASPYCGTHFFARKSGWPGIYANEGLYTLAKNMIGFPSLISLSLPFISFPSLCWLKKRSKFSLSVPFYQCFSLLSTNELVISSNASSFLLSVLSLLQCSLIRHHWSVL